MLGTARVIIPLIRFQLFSFVSSSFQVFLRYTFFIFSFILTSFMMSTSKIPKYLYVCFSLWVLILSWFGCPIPFVMCRFPLFIISMAHFSLPNPIPMSGMYILTACIRVLVIVHLPGIYLFSSLVQSSFYLQLSIPLSKFSWFSR